MGRSVFISYRHHQAEFVRRDLAPVLRAAGAGEVFIDVQRFTAGRELVAQMDATQDKADVTLAVLSPDYLASPMCIHEMDRAIAADPGFALGKVLPVVLRACAIPPQLSPPGHLLRIHLDKNPADPAQWAGILRALDAADLGTDAPRWLDARRKCEEALAKHEPAILHITTHGANWRALFGSLRDDCGLAIPTVDLRDGATASRRALVEEILAQLGVPARVPKEPDDLVVLSRQLKADAKHRLIIRHLECAREKKRGYGADWVRSLRHLMEKRALVPLFQTHEAFDSVMQSLLPPGSKDSPIVSRPVIEL